ncbi:MAG: anti-sigma factor family protein [Pseudomonadota bacterium]
MRKSMTCEHCRTQLFDVVDGAISAANHLEVNQHLDTCEDCSNRLAELWQLAALASRWQDRSVPQWNRRGFFFDSRPWFPVLQVASACASVVVMILVLTQVQLSVSDGLTVRFGNSYALEESVDAKIAELKAQQSDQLRNSVERLTSQQAASNQLLLRAALTATRSERKEDLSNLLVILAEIQGRRFEQTEASLQYLVDTQIEDRRNIRQLGQALRLVAGEGGT